MCAMLQETATKAFELFKRARKAEEGRVMELQAALSHVQDAVAHTLPADEKKRTVASAAADAAAVQPGVVEKIDGMDVEMQDTEAVDGS
jgi:hypothetical protein